MVREVVKRSDPDMAGETCLQTRGYSKSSQQHFTSPAARLTVAEPVVCRERGGRNNVCQVQRRLRSIRELWQSLHGSRSVSLGHAPHGAAQPRWFAGRLPHAVLLEDVVAVCLGHVPPPEAHLAQVVVGTV